MRPGDVERGAELRPLSLGRPERCDQVELPMRRLAHGDRKLVGTGGLSVREQQDQRRRLRVESELAKTRIYVGRDRYRDPEDRPERPLEVMVEGVLEERGLPLAADSELLDEVEPRYRELFMGDEGRSGELESKAAHRQDELAFGSKGRLDFELGRAGRHGRGKARALRDVAVGPTDRTRARAAPNDY